METFRVNPIDRVLQHISIQVGIAPIEKDGVLGGPAAGFGVVVPGAKAGQLGVRVIQPTRIAKGLKTGVAVMSDCAPHVVVHSLGYAAGFGVHDQTHAAQVVADDLVALAPANHGAGAVGFVGVDVEGFELAAW